MCRSACVIMSMLIMAGVAARLDTLHGRIETAKAPGSMVMTAPFDTLHGPIETHGEKRIKEEVTGERGTREDKRLFDALVKNNLIFPRDKFMGDQLLAFVPSDYRYVLDMEMAKDPSPLYENSGTSRSFINSVVTAGRHGDYKKKETAHKIELVKQLHESQAGLAIQRAVHLWNSAHCFAAIRDDRPMGKDSPADGHNRWEVRDPQYPRLYLGTSGQVPDFAVFVNGSRMNKGFHEWISVPFSFDDGSALFSTTMDSTIPVTLTIQVVGSVVDAHVTSVFGHGTETVAIEQDKIQPVAIPEITNSPFNSLQSPSSFPGTRISLGLPGGNHLIEIVTEPALFRRDTIPGLNIAWHSGKEWPQSVKWVDTGTYVWREPSLFSVAAGNGKELIKVQGRDVQGTRELWELGLASFTGTSLFHSNSLLGILSTAPMGGEVVLTIDPDIQRIVKDALNEQIALLGENDMYRNVRRGAVVMMDADTGGIIAAYSFPHLDAGMSQWDIRAFATYYPGLGPGIFKPWKGIDAHNTPGSVFKPVTAMAAILARQKNAPGSAVIERMLLGVKEEELDELGLTPWCAAYNPLDMRCYRDTLIPDDPVVVQNFRREPLGRGFTLKHDRKMGLEEALRDSVNVWFVRLAQLVDGSKAAEGDRAWTGLVKGAREPEHPDFYLGRIARILGFDTGPMDLLFNFPPSLPLQRDVISIYSEGDTLKAQTGKIALLDKNERGYERILARNSFGHGMTVSPLQMARIAAAIATGKVLSPYVVKEVNGQETEPGQGYSMGIEDRWLELIQKGLSAVVHGGSAREAFNVEDRVQKITPYKHVGKIYGKTGTAENHRVLAGRGKHQLVSGFNTAWFAGYRESVTEDTPRIAFACMVEHY
ncbi:MAG: hypothetical protein HQK66_09415 [Desulfamplus sp.]|nr:hypothetical protein [Desulfamplus sp.]